MKKKILSILQYIIFLGGGIFLVWWQLKNMSDADQAEFFKAFRKANYLIIIPIVIMSLLSHLSRSMRWKLLMEPLGYKPKLKNVFAATMVGYLANSAIPRLGEILKCSILARYEKLKIEKLVGTILVERTFDLICFFIFIGITVLIQIEKIGGYVKNQVNAIAENQGASLWIKILIVLLIIIGIIIFIRLLMRRFPQNKIIAKVNGFISGIGSGFATIKNLKHRKLFIAHTLFIWSMYLLQIYIGFFAMEGTTGLSLKAACSVLTLATLAMIATPGGIGSFPIFVMQVLLIYGISRSTGQAFGWMVWGVSTGIIIVSGVLALILLPYMNKNYLNETDDSDSAENILSS